MDKVLLKIITVNELQSLIVPIKNHLVQSVNKNNNKFTQASNT